MSNVADALVAKEAPERRRVHVIGAGPVGLMTAALLQSIEGLTVLLYEQRADYTRSRMVHLEPYLVADTIESYRAAQIDEDDIDAVCDPREIEQGIAFRQSIAADLKSLMQEWTLGFCPLNEIEHSLSNLIAARESNPVQRVTGVLTAQQVMDMVEPRDIVIDCTGRKSLLRDEVVPSHGTDDQSSNTVNLRLEHALVVTFLYDQNYSCNELCKYYKNSDNLHYKFIPSVSRTFANGDLSHVTGIIHITSDEAEAMPAQFDGEWLRGNFPEVAASMDRFIARIENESHGKIVGDLQVISIPLNLYRARNATSKRWRTHGDSQHPFANSPVFLTGDSAIGSPYFQSISLGFECAMHLASLLTQPELPTDDVLDLYERHVYEQWLRVYMRSKMIKHDKDIFEALDDKMEILELIRLY